MISHVIKLRSSCTKDKIINHINNFLTRVDFKTRYLSIQLSFVDENGKDIKIGDPYFLDIKSEREVKTYKFYIIQYYVYNYLPENEATNISKLIFSYTECNRKQYRDHISSIIESMSHTD